MRILGVLIVTSLLVVSHLASGAPPEKRELDLAPQADTPGAAADAAPGLADRDNDGLSDGLGARLATAAANEKFDIVVTFAEPGHSAATARDTIGRFTVSRKFSVIGSFPTACRRTKIEPHGSLPR